MPREIIKSRKNIDVVGGGGGCGWQVDWGQEVIYKYLLPKVGNKSKVLDLCCGSGWVSIPLMMSGALAVWVDRDLESLNHGRQYLKDAGISKKLIMVINRDVNQLSQKDVGKFDFVVACNAITHMTKTLAANFILSLNQFVKPGGLVYVDVPSRSSSSYDFFVEGYSDGDRVDLDTYETFCGCSGEVKLEPIPFFTPGEAEYLLRQRKGRIIYSKEIETWGGNFNREIVASF